MKNYAHKTNKQMTRYRTSSTFRGQIKINQKPLPKNFSKHPITNNQSSNKS